MASSPTTISGERSRHSANALLGLHAERDQVMGEAVGARIELAVGER